MGLFFFSCQLLIARPAAKCLNHFGLKTGIQLCPKCHPVYGCGHEHGGLLHDTGTCSVCGETTDVVNCRLANLAQTLGLCDEYVWRYLPRLVRDKALEDVEDLYRSATDSEVKGI